jgi:polyvinyl alcohol dehydrogenase (cytochrome)
MRASFRALLAGCAVSALAFAGCQTEDAAAPAHTAAAPPAAPTPDTNAQQIETASQTVERAAHPGSGVYAQACAACHDQPEATRSPSKDTLSKMSFQFINYALTEGKMKLQGAALSAEQRADVISYLTGRDASVQASWTPSMMCPADRRTPNLTASATITGFGFDRANTRALTAAQAGLGKAQLARLEPAWSMGFPDATTMRAQPAVVGSTMFYPVADAGAMYAVDISDKAKPCLQWVYTAPGGAPLRTSAAFGVTADGTPLLVFSGLDSTVHAVDARTGKAVWTKGVGYYSHSLTTGTPTVLRDRVIVPVSQYEISVAADNAHPCCSNHGYVLSLDPRTGEQQWRYDTMEDAKPVRDRGDGKMLLGPSGAPIWNSPLVDEARGLIYFGTGESNSPPVHRNTNALIAIDLKTGKERWSNQKTPRDIFNSGCGPNPKPEQLNCVKADETVYRDVDFGASVILGKLADGSELLFAGQKSGSVWALEPATGKVRWRKALGTGGPLGGVHWGIAYANGTVFVPITSPGRPIPGEWEGDPAIKPGVYALDARTGAIKWAFNPAPDPAAGPRGARGVMMSAAPVYIDGVLVAASLDGTVYTIDAESGKLLWSYKTAAEHQTVNGVPAKGGAVDAASIWAANGLLFVNSGYGMFGQAAGNALIAFKPAAQ